MKSDEPFREKWNTRGESRKVSFVKREENNVMIKRSVVYLKPLLSEVNCAMVLLVGLVVTWINLTSHYFLMYLP